MLLLIGASSLLFLAWVLLSCDAYAVTHRKLNWKAKPVDEKDEHDLIYVSPRVWAERAAAQLMKRIKHGE